MTEVRQTTRDEALMRELLMLADLTGTSSRDRETLRAAAARIDSLRADLLTIASVAEGWAQRHARKALGQ